MSHLGHRSSMFNLIKASHFATNFIFIVVKLDGLFWPWLNTMKHVLFFYYAADLERKCSSLQALS